GTRASEDSHLTPAGHATDRSRPGGRFVRTKHLPRRRRDRTAPTGLPSEAFHRILGRMSRSLLPEAVERYVAQDIARETAVQKKLRAETARLRQAGMQIGADQGALLALLVRAIGAKSAIEIGTFTGYSALAVATALPVGG